LFTRPQTASTLKLSIGFGTLHNKRALKIRKIFVRPLAITVLLITGGICSGADSQQIAINTDVLTGHFSREGNNDTPAETINNNIYIKLFEDNWIATLYVPYPYAASLQANIIDQVLDQVRHQASSSAFIRGKFGHLQENATVHLEKFGFVEDQIVYECGSLAPCTIKLHQGYLELIKPGVINEHIIKYHHVKVGG
jgi:hypothetical protein